MSSTDSMDVSPAPPPQFENANELQWIQENNAGVPGNRTQLQWTELPPPGLVPLTCNDPSPVYTAGPPVFNQRKFNLPNNVNTYNPRNYTDVSFVNEAGSSFSLPNGTRLINGSPNAPNPRPVMPNGAFVNNPNSWMPPQNPNHLMTRPGWTATKTTSGARKPKRIRTAFNSHQMMELEQEYARTRYLDRTRRIELAELLHLNERTIKIWFQNRRMKEKKDKAEILDEEEATSTTDSSTDLNAMPIIIRDDMPNEAFNRNVYMEYPAVSAANMMAVPMPMAQPAEMMNSYPYIPVDYECRQVHLQMQQYPPPYNNVVQEIVQQSPPPVVEPATETVPSTVTEQKWDCSWFRTIQLAEDY